MFRCCNRMIYIFLGCAFSVPIIIFPKFKVLTVNRFFSCSLEIKELQTLN